MSRLINLLSTLIVAILAIIVIVCIASAVQAKPIEKKQVIIEKVLTCRVLEQGFSKLMEATAIENMLRNPDIVSA